MERSDDAFYALIAAENYAPAPYVVHPNFDQTVRQDARPS